MIKSVLKGIPVAAKINAMIKGAQTKNSYRQWCKRYGTPCVMEGADKRKWAQHFMAGTAHWAFGPVPAPTRRFFFVGTNWDQDRSGLIQGLRGFGEVGVLRGPDGRNECRLARDPSDVEAYRIANGIAIESEFAEFARHGAVSALIGQMWNHTVPAATLGRIRASGVPIINLAMDDRHSFHGTPLADGSDSGVAGLVREISLGATAAPECVAWYEHLGTPALFLPEASDSSLFRPAGQLKAHDITFVGANYGFRGRVVVALRRAGLRVTTYGSGWPAGRIETEAIPPLFAGSRIVLGIGAILHCADLTALKMRDFDAPMSGSFYLAQENPDLDLVFQVGKEIETWRDLTQLVEKCRRYLADEGPREQIAAAGRARALAEHTWARRFHLLLRKIGVISNSVSARIETER